MIVSEPAGCTILVVDDEPEITKLLRFVLEADGHQVVDADEQGALGNYPRDGKRPYHRKG